MRRYLGILMAALIPAFIAIPSNASTPAKAAPYNPLTYSGPNAMQKLVKAADAEGSVTVLTALAGPILQALPPAWAKTYPDITLNLTRSASDQTVLQQQESAHQVSLDVVSTNNTALLFRQLGLIEPFYSPNTKLLPKQLMIKAPHGQLWAISGAQDVIDFAYNTNLLPASEVPKTLEDLTNPDLKGKMAIQIETDGVTAGWTGEVEYALGNKATSFLQQMSTQNMSIFSASSQALAQSIAAGTTVAAPAIFADHAFELEAAGSPIRYVPLLPGEANVYMHSIANDAPHPAAALLYLDWLSSRAGQAIFAHYYYVTPKSPLPSQFQSQVKGLTKAWSAAQTCPTPFQYQACTTKWDNQDTQYFNNG